MFVDGRLEQISFPNLGRFKSGMQEWTESTQVVKIFITLPPAIMEVKNYAYFNLQKLILEEPSFHFHDYGRNSKLIDWYKKW